jgi:adenylate cyclase
VVSHPGRAAAQQTPTFSNEVSLFGRWDDIREPAVRELRQNIEANGNRLVLKIADDAGILYSDSVKLRQILFNLLSNAAKFTRDGTIHLIVERRRNPGCADDIIVRVVDTGIGIKQEYLDRVFDPFIQAGNDIGRKFGGTGLGLTVSRRLCELLGGEINVESTLGAGAAFTLKLPSSQSDTVMEKAPAVPAELLEPNRTGNVNGGRILVVEDDPRFPALLHKGRKATRLAT